MHGLQPGADGVVVDQLPRADPAGKQHHVRRGDLVEPRVAAQPEHAVFGTHLAAAVTDEHDLDRRDALQHLVGAHRVERGHPGKQRDGDECHGTAGSASGIAVRRTPDGRSRSGSQPGGASGARSKGPPDGSSTRPPQRTKSSSGR